MTWAGARPFAYAAPNSSSSAVSALSRCLAAAVFGRFARSAFAAAVIARTGAFAAG